MVCLETDFLVAILRAEPEAIKKFEALYSLENELTITPVSAAEIFGGAFKSGKEEKIKKTEQLINSLSMLEFDFHASKEAGVVLAYLEKNGSKIGEMDSLIGGIALRHGEKLVTRNAKHFSKIKGLEIEKW